MSDASTADWGEALSESFDKVEAATEPAATEPVAEPAAAVETPEPAAVVPEPITGDRPRGPDGKFLPVTAKANPSPKHATGAPEAATVPPVVPPAPAFKAPQSWKPEERESWATVPPAAQAAIDRREREHAVSLQRATEQVRAVEPIMRAVQPYAQALQQRGQSVDQVVGNFLRTEQALSHPDERSRAAVLAQAMRTYSVSVEALAGAIDGTAQPAAGAASHTLDPNAIIAEAEQRVMARLNASQQQSAQQKATAAVESFKATGKAEFLEDLKAGMAARLGAGLAKSLEEAYEQECWADSRIRGILQQREASKQAATGAQATQRARAASTSVKSSPGSAGNGAPPVDTWEDALRAQMKD